MGEPAAGRNPDAVCYEPKTKRVFAMNHTGGQRRNRDRCQHAFEIVATFPAGGPAPEFCAVDGAGKVYVNLEGSSEVLEIDAAKPAVTRRVELTPNEGPSGLAIDVKNKKLFAVCGGTKTMAVVDIRHHEGHCDRRQSAREPRRGTIQAPDLPSVPMATAH